MSKLATLLARGDRPAKSRCDAIRDSGCCHRIGHPATLTRCRTPIRSAISRSFARLAARKRPTKGSPRSFSIPCCQRWALKPSRSKIPASSSAIEAFPWRKSRPVYSTSSRDFPEFLDSVLEPLLAIALSCAQQVCLANTARHAVMPARHRHINQFGSGDRHLGNLLGEQLYCTPCQQIRRDRVPCLSSKITIATGRASIISQPEWLKLPVSPEGNDPVVVLLTNRPKERKARESNPHSPWGNRVSSAARQTVSGYLPVTTIRTQCGPPGSRTPISWLQARRLSVGPAAQSIEHQPRSARESNSVPLLTRKGCRRRTRGPS
jgi:hypothetical protein